VIKIRYEDLPGGLHARAELQGKDVIIYLLPGLTPSQRKAALGRLRACARMGQAPSLPAAGVRRARLADRARVNARNVFAAVRLHPLMFIPPTVIVLAAVIASIMLVRVTVRLGPAQAAGSLPAPAASAPAAAGPGSSFRRDPDPGGQQGSAPVGPPASASPHQPGTISQLAAGAPSPSPDPAESVPASPAPSRSPEPSPAAPSPSPAGSRSSGGSGGSGGLCLNLSVLGVCLSV
jgi:hypothetical protein